LTYVGGQVTFAVSPLIRGKISLARKILLADDSVTAQNMGRKILADAGYEVVTVNNGSAALKKIAELKPDLVILDVYMPGYSGLEVCQRLKESQDSARIPVLLTVGKLEPFKPEEAQRVRAEGFIVKPFEASELLSALSKLEDKVVPRAEPSKPGRFARAIAAAEESGRGGRNEVPGGGDDGWRSRISFPHKKTEAEEKAADDPSIYNAMNRDLRTVVETPAELAADKAAEQGKKADHKEGHEEKHHPAATAGEASVDVAALVPPGLPQAGLPQDVTPEEVAAITAAAAQIQMLGAALKAEPAIAEAPRSAAVESAAKPSAEDQAERSVSSQPHAASDLTPAMNVEGRAEAVAERENEKPDKDKVESAATEAAAVSMGVRRNDNGNETAIQRDNDSNDDRLDETQDLPVTMAATAESASIAAANGGGSRWTAVAVALEGDEATISLEQEMQKAYAAFVAEETTAASTATLPVPQASAPENSIASEPDVPIASVSTPEPEAPQSEPVVSAVVAESESAPARQFDTVAIASSLPTAESATHLESTQVSLPQPEAAFTTPATSDFAPAAECTQPSPATELVEQPSEPVCEALSPAMETGAPDQVQPPAESIPVASEAVASSDAFSPIVAEQIVVEPIVSEPVVAEPIVSTEPAEESMEESESVKSTAAAWASWRQIRDTGEAKPVAERAESAAMAVAAGAEQIAQESAAVPPENPQDVASIVDSVLADLRPRLMAEISRKMSEKK
jgi:two-component system chemotaxis response regulator CheY